MVPKYFMDNYYISIYCRFIYVKGEIMEFIFVKTEELKEFEQDIKRTIRYIKKFTWQTILGSFLIYAFIVLMIISLP